jgi:hypothetical protein
MRKWPRYPVIYEINTWVWLGDSRKHRKPVNLATVPPEKRDQIASLGFDAVWLMGGGGLSFTASQFLGGRSADADELIEFASALKKDVIAWLVRKHPDLLPPAFAV